MYLGPGEAPPGMEEKHKLIKEKVITGDTGEEIILKNGVPAMSMYSDRTHMCISGRCWPDWGKDRRRNVRRLGCAPWRTGLLLTASDGQDCHEERVEQTLSGNMTVKALTWLLFYDPPDLEFQLGRDNAVCLRIHRMLKLGHWGIDDDDEELSDDGGQGLGRSGPGRRKSNSMHAPNCLDLALF